MLQQLKSAFLYSAKASGAFEIASRITADRVRILCYHGTSFENEHRLYPGTFIQPETFRHRMSILRDWGATVLPLDEALMKLRKNSLPRKAVVITIDDGWFGTYSEMLPVLQEFGFPATIYLSTYYIEKQTFVFNLFVEYILAQTKADVLNLSQVDERLTGNYRLRDRIQARDAVSQIVSHGESTLHFLEREALCFKLAAVCDYDIENAQEKRMFKFMSGTEVAELPALGFDVQLHTHTHAFSRSDKGAAVLEVKKNMQSLSELGITARRHFCYPSGEYAAEHPAWLRELDIESAVTTDFGLATPDSAPFLLPRICDSDAMRSLDFEGALSGFKDLVRKSG